MMIVDCSAYGPGSGVAPKLSYVVHFHADGGQACCPGRRAFPTRAQAEIFANKMRCETGHSCGPEAVSIAESKLPVEDCGFLYWQGDQPTSRIKSAVNPSVEK